MEKIILDSTKCCLLSRDNTLNDSLAIGKIGPIYDLNLEYGVISKLNRFYSAMFDNKSPSNLSPYNFPFYSNELYNAFKEVEELDDVGQYSHIIPPYGRIKLNLPLKDINKSNLGLPSTHPEYENTLQNTLNDLLELINNISFTNGESTDTENLEINDETSEESTDNPENNDETSESNQQETDNDEILNSNSKVIAYDYGWKYQSSPSNELLSSLLKSYTGAITNVIQNSLLNIINQLGDSKKDLEEQQKAQLEELINKSKLLELPIGTIIMWSGKADNVPDGWSICDGRTENGITTPNLTHRFIRGAKADDVNEIGGNESITIEEKLLPLHQHKVYGLFGYLGDNANRRFMPTNYKTTNITKPDGTLLDYSTEDAEQGATVNTGYNRDESVAGGLESINILPLYYNLYFIMKTKNILFEDTAEEIDN